MSVAGVVVVLVGLNLLQPRLSFWAFVQWQGIDIGLDRSIASARAVRVLDDNFNFNGTAGSHTSVSATVSNGTELETLTQRDNEDQEDQNNPYQKDAAFCSSPEGSLHQLALDMFHHSSPPGSPSYQKLRHVLDNGHQLFFIDLGAPIFSPIQVSMASMLEGYGLTRIRERPTNDTSSTITLVETQFTNSPCPIHAPARECQDRFRIYLQSEQKLGPHLKTCHEGPNCVVLEFSDYNYRMVQEQGWADSFVLLPIMTQQPSRLKAFLPETSALTPLHNRTLDMVFF